MNRAGLSLKSLNVLYTERLRARITEFNWIYKGGLIGPRIRIVSIHASDSLRSTGGIVSKSSCGNARLITSKSHIASLVSWVDHEL